MEGIGLALLVIGTVLLGVGSYFYEIDFQFDEKIRETPTNSDYMGPIHLPPYYFLQPILTDLGVILVGIGIVLLSYKKIKKRINLKSH